MNAADTLTARIDAYLASRRQAAFALLIEGQQLKRFARFADQARHRGPLTVKLAVQWASDSRGQRPLTAARRIEVLRPFASYCQQFDPATEIPPRWLFGRAHRRLTPHIFADHEIRSLLAACAQLYPPSGLRGASCAAIFGLIAATGLRISEATGLTRSDVDLKQRLLHIRRAKFGKSRWVPLHASTAGALRRYVQRRDRDSFATNTDA
jgi:integrase